MERRDFLTLSKDAEPEVTFEKMQAELQQLEKSCLGAHCLPIVSATAIHQEPLENPQLMAFIDLSASPSIRLW